MQALERPAGLEKNAIPRGRTYRALSPFAWYIPLVLLSFLIANFALDRVQKREVSVLSHSILLYTRHDEQAASLAAWAGRQLSLHTIDLLSPGAGGLVYHLTGTRTVVSPTLLIPTSGSYATVSGSSAVNQALQPVTSLVTPVQKAKQALLIMAGLILLALILQVEFSAVASFLPAAGLVAVGALWGHCWHCYSGASTLSTLAPLFELIYLGFGLCLFSLSSVRHRIAFLCFSVVSALVPAVQAYMLVTEPKLCPACLTVTFISACYFVASLRTLRAERLSGVAAPQWVRTVFVIGLIGLLIRHSLVLAGYVTLGKPTEEAVPSIIGSPISRYVTASSTYAPGTLLVVSLPGCRACEQAARELPDMRLVYRIIPTCSVITTQPCFDGKGLTFPTPMLLIYGKDGRIIYQHEGWVGPTEDQERLALQISTVQRRISPPN